MLGEAKELQGRYTGQIAEQARTLDVNKLLSAVRLEAEKYIPFDVNDVELDAQKLAMGKDASGKPEMKVLLVAAKKAVVADHARLLTELGLQPVIVGVDGFALGNAWELGDMVNPGIQEPGRTVALIDVGATKASINILRDNVSCFAREVPMGGQDLTNAIARRLGIEPAQAEALKRDPGDQMLVVQEACGQVLDDLGNEVNLSTSSRTSSTGKCRRCASPAAPHCCRSSKRASRRSSRSAPRPGTRSRA